MESPVSPLLIQRLDRIFSTANWHHPVLRLSVERLAVNALKVWERRFGQKEPRNQKGVAPAGSNVGETDRLHNLNLRRPSNQK